MFQVKSLSASTHNIIPDNSSDKICVICSVDRANKIAELLNKDIEQNSTIDSSIKPKTADSMGGTLSIPDGYFVCNVDLDAEIPFCVICDTKTLNERMLKIPKSLAYYLTTHHNGSTVFRKELMRDAQNILRNKLRNLLENSNESIDR
jgi:hypothetical protein